jgi:hypothetical protein
VKTDGKGWAPYFFYALLGLAVLGTLLKPGYILTLDGPFTSRLASDSQFFGLNQNFGNSTMPFWFIFQLISRVIPAWVIQKLIFFLVFFLAGLGAHRLFPFRGAGNYFAGLFYAITPFVYVRFLAGQMGVLWAYALTPFAVKAFIDLLTRRDIKSAIKVAILSTLVGILQLQGFLLLLFVFIIIFLVYSASNRRQPIAILAAARYALLSGGLFLVLNLYWLVPTLISGSSILGQVSPQDELLFAPQVYGGRILFETAAMYGFWRGGYIYAKDILPLWWVLFVLILFLAVYGLISRIKPTPAPSSNYAKVIPGFNSQGPSGEFPGSDWIAISFGIIWIISLLLAVGAAASQTKPAFDWLWDHFSLLRGFRDSQKFVALLCLAYAYLGAWGVNELVRGIKQLNRKLPRIGLTSLVVISFLAPLAYSFTIFGFDGQLGTTDYPRDWYEANSYLNQDKSDFNVLVLPWHQYMDFGWLPNQDQRLANPAQQFFDKPVIQGDNLEMPGIYSESTNQISKYVEFILANQNKIDNLGELLAPLNVKYVILLHEADYTGYDFLNKQSDLVIARDWQGLTLFENRHSLARVYGVDDVVQIQNLDEYLKLSQEQDVMQHVYILGNSPGSVQATSVMLPVGVTEKNPVDYSVEGSSQKYLVFTIPQGVTTEQWKYNGQAAVFRNLGFMPVFESSGAGDIVYTRFYQVDLPADIVSALALLGIFGFWVYRRVRF